jgi:hypothetical protein
MRVSSFAVARPAWYDRNPATTLLHYAGTISPAGNTVRYSTTVAAGKLAYLDMLTCVQDRVTVATANPDDYARLYITPSGGTGTMLLENHQGINSVGYGTSNVIANAGTLIAGDLLELYTASGTTGGSVRISSSIKITTFDR